MCRYRNPGEGIVPIAGDLGIHTCLITTITLEGEIA